MKKPEYILLQFKNVTLKLIKNSYLCNMDEPHLIIILKTKILSHCIISNLHFAITLSSLISSSEYIYTRFLYTPRNISRRAIVSPVERFADARTTSKGISDKSDLF